MPFIQNYSDGTISKTSAGKYQFIKGGRVIGEYLSVAELVKNHPEKQANSGEKTWTDRLAKKPAKSSKKQ